MLVEDSEDDALLLLRELRREDHRIEHKRVQTAGAMREALASSSWDVVFSDYRMPRFSAMEALEIAQQTGVEAPFIVVSGRIGEDVAVAAMKAGAYDYVMKDNLTRIHATVKRGLQEAEERRERRRAEEKVRESERLYRAVVEQATENIFLIDVQSKRIVESNAAFREALGYSEKELHRMRIYDVVADKPESVDDNVRSVVEQKSPSVGERRYVRKDGSLLEVEVSASVILRDGRETLVTVAHDITERARAQRLLEERVSTLSGIAGSLTLDLPVKNTLDVLAESVVGASTSVACAVALFDERTGTLGMEGFHSLPAEHRAGVEAAWQMGADSPTMRAVQTREPVLVRGISGYVLDDALYASIHNLVREAPWDAIYIVPLISRGRALGAINLGYLPDQEPGEDEKIFLKAVADQAAVAVENARLFAEARGKAALEERQKLARELHDSVSQALYGIILGVETARELLKTDPQSAAEPLDYAAALSEAGMTEMRALIFELRPESLEKEGLVVALEKQAAAIEARYGVRVKAVICEEPEAPLEIKEALYRIVQEALHNTVKHARATNAEIVVESVSGWISVKISDDGVGFDGQSDFPGHLGLRSMRERATRIGGTLEIKSFPGKGTTIYARLPS